MDTSLKDSRKLSTRIVTAVFAVMVSAFMAVAMVPSSAFAASVPDEDLSSGYFPTGTPGVHNSLLTGTITPYFGTIDVQVGEQLDMNTDEYFKPDVKEWPNATPDMKLVWHLDFMITSGSEYASINKHTGILTAIAPGDVTVTAYLIPYIHYQSGANKLCYDQWVYAANDFVHVTAATEYGYQGGSNALILASVGTGDEVTAITPDDVTVQAGSSLENGYKNTLKVDVPNQDDCVYFTYQTIAGFKDHATPDEYALYNAGNISFTTDKGKTYTLSADNTGFVTIAAVDADAQQVTVKIDLEELQSEGGTLTFDKALKANNPQRTLEANVSFDFKVG